MLLDDACSLLEQYLMATNTGNSTDRQTDGQTGRQTDGWTDGQTDWRTDWLTSSLTDWLTDGLTDWPVFSQKMSTLVLSFLYWSEFSRHVNTITNLGKWRQKQKWVNLARFVGSWTPYQAWFNPVTKKKPTLSRHLGDNYSRVQRVKKRKIDSSWCK